MPRTYTIHYFLSSIPARSPINNSIDTSNILANNSNHISTEKILRSFPSSGILSLPYASRSSYQHYVQSICIRVIYNGTLVVQKSNTEQITLIPYRAKFVRKIRFHVRCQKAIFFYFAYYINLPPNLNICSFQALSLSSHQSILWNHSLLSTHQLIFISLRTLPPYVFSLEVILKICTSFYPVLISPRTGSVLLYSKSYKSRTACIRGEGYILKKDNIFLSLFSMIVEKMNRLPRMPLPFTNMRSPPHLI